MAVTILKRGQVQKERNYRTTCSACGTVFMFTENDAEFVADQRDGNFFRINCPLQDCGKELGVDESTHIKVYDNVHRN